MLLIIVGIVVDLGCFALTSTCHKEGDCYFGFRALLKLALAEWVKWEDGGDGCCGCGAGERHSAHAYFTGGLRIRVILQSGG